MVMVLLEELCCCPTDLGAKAYFNDLETRLNNGVLAEMNSNWAIPSEGNELKKISLSNVTSCTFVIKIDELFDLVFEHRYDGGDRRSQFQKCGYMYPQIMVKSRQRHDFKDGEIVQLQ